MPVRLRRWAFWWLWLVPLVLLPAQVGADGRSDWLAEFYNNPYLIGDPIVAQVGAVSFDWGAGAPTSGVNADNFSARFSTRAALNPGTYRFFARADDGVRVTVGGQVLIDTLDAPRVGATLSRDVTLSGTSHVIQVDYRELTGDAYVFVTWERVSGAADPAPNFPPITTTTTEAIDLAPWLAQYYPNQLLSGFPSAIFSEDAVTEDWGRGSPVPSVPTDNFSARWSASATLPAGRYRLTTRADDGVRVFVDGETVIDRWVNAVGQVTTRDINLEAGQHTFVVEYYEDGGEAYIEFALEQVNETQTIPTPVPAVKLPSAPTPVVNARGTVDAFRLNVRAAPTTDSGIVAQIDRGETYPIVGRNADDSWWQIDVDGSVGWAFADFIVATNTAAVPVTSASRQSDGVVGTGLLLSARVTVNLRSRPGRSGAVLGLLPFNAQAEIVGRNRDGSWVQVNYNGTLAWVSTDFVRLPVPTSEIPEAIP